jgi:hypothetical protein
MENKFEFKKLIIGIPSILLISFLGTFFWILPQISNGWINYNGSCSFTCALFVVWDLVCLRIIYEVIEWFWGYGNFQNNRPKNWRIYNDQ